MKKILSITLVCLALLACKKKSSDEEPQPTETKGSVEFNVFIKLFESTTPLNATQIKIAKSQSDLNAGTLLATLTTSNNGKASWEDQEQGSYYYKAIYISGSDEFSSEGSFAIGASGMLTKNVSMKQTAGQGSITVRVIKSGFSDSLVVGANVSIDYAYTNLTTTPMFQQSSNSYGTVTFSNLNIDTVFCRVQATINNVAKDTSLGYLLLPNDRNQYYRVVF